MTEPVAEAGGEFVLVPREPTKAMIQASFDSMKPYKFRELTKRKKVQARWAAMLAAAPATSAPATLRGMIAAIYEGMDAEDSARIDREWRDFRALSAPAGDGEAEKLAALNPALPKLLRALAQGSDAKRLQHDVIFEAAAKELDAHRRAQPPQPTGDVGKLVERLRLGAGKSRDVGSHLSKYQALCDEAADLIVSLGSRPSGLAQDREIELLRKLEAAANRATTAEARVAELEKAVNEACDIAVGASDDMTRTAKQRIDDLRKIAALSPTEPADKKKE